MNPPNEITEDFFKDILSEKNVFEYTPLKQYVAEKMSLKDINLESMALDEDTNLEESS